MPRGTTVTLIPPPVAGAHGDKSDHALNRDEVPISPTVNVLYRDGWLVPRPGLKRITSSALATDPNGLADYQAGSSRKVVAASTTTWSLLNGGTWTDLTDGNALAGSLDDPTRFIIFPTGGKFWLTGVNGLGIANNRPRKWDGSSATYEYVGGTPPPAKDIFVIGNRVVLVYTEEDDSDGLGVLPRPYRLRFSEFNDIDTWPLINTVELTDTSDVLVGGTALGRVNAAIYKKQGQWLMTLQRGTYPFKIELIDRKPGPVSAAAVIDAEGTHFYLGEDLSIYAFDGTRATDVGLPVQRYITSTMHYERRHRSFAAFFDHDNTIWFFYPGTTATAGCNRAVSFNLALGQWFRHEFSFEFTAACTGPGISAVTWADLQAAGYTWATITTTYPTWASMESASTLTTLLMRLGSSANHLYALHAGTYADDATDFTCTWRSPNLAPDGASYWSRAQSLDTWFEASTSGVAQTVTVKVGSTDSLAAAATFSSDLQTTFDLTSAAAKELTLDTTTAGAGTGLAEARFVAIEHTTTQTAASRSNWRWGGCALRSYPNETP